MKDKSPLITLLRALGKLIPGTYLKTAFYLNFILRPRKALRLMLNSFYRVDHVYEVIAESKRRYRGNFSILEFGVADGYSFTKKLYATKYLGMTDRIQVHGFDTFEGMPAPAGDEDLELVTGDHWIEGEYAGSYESLDDYCRQHYSNYRLHKGLFTDTLDDRFLQSLSSHLPILIWMDCDYYSSSKTVLERLMPYLPSGCVVYFDEPEFNFGSRFTGEVRLIHEINHGHFGEGIELLLDTGLSLNSQRVYRFVNTQAPYQFDPVELVNLATRLRRRAGDSPFP